MYLEPIASSWTRELVTSTHFGDRGRLDTMALSPSATEGVGHVSAYGVQVLGRGVARAALVIVVWSLVSACAARSPTVGDAGQGSAQDAGEGDALPGGRDAGADDARVEDASADDEDASVQDAGAEDTGAPDASGHDVGPRDAGEAAPVAFDEVLQGYEDTFSEVSGEATLYSYQKNPATGIAGGIDLPPAWRTLEPGAAVRLRLLVPPGVDYGTIYIQAWSMDAYIGTCDGLTADCPLAQANGSPPFWPRPPDGAASPASTPAIVSLVVRAALDPFTFSSLAITWHVADAALYRAWRADRPWAGGAGDCDGLGGAYCR